MPPNPEADVTQGSTPRPYKSFLIGALIVLLSVTVIASGIFNFLQYKEAAARKEIISFFESNFGTYEQNLAEAEKIRLIQEENARKIIVRLKRGVVEDQIFILKSTLELHPDIAAVKYESSEESLSEFEDKHQNDPVYAQALEELDFNPFNVTLTITLSNPSQKEAIKDFIRSSDTASIVEDVF